MKTTKLLFIALFFAAPNLFPQMVEKSYVILTTGEKLFGKVEYTNPLLGEKGVMLNDTTKIPLSKVKFFENADGYFGVVRSNFSFNVVRRIKVGKINLFNETSSYYAPPAFHTVSTPGGSFTVSSGGGGVNFMSSDYFNKGDGDIKAVSYANLKKELADNPVSIEYLESYNLCNIISWGLVITGLGLTIGTMASASKEEPPSGAMLTIGIGTAISAWIPYLMKGGNMQKAIETYNAE
ncbi:MAG: hypothetical protein V1720_18190 [bacterium]